MATKRDTSEMLDELTQGVAAVRPLWSPNLRLLVWALVQVSFAAYIIAGGYRPDLRQQLSSPSYIAEMSILCAALLLFARASLGAAVPGGAPWGMAGLGLATTLVGGLFVTLRAPDTDQVIASFVTMGLPCAAHTSLLALLPTSWLLVASYRGFPLSPARAGAIAGGAGFVFGFALMRLLCAADEPLHVVTWHWVPVLVGSAVAAAAGSILFARKK